MINPFTAQVDGGTFYNYPALRQRLHMIETLFLGKSRLLVIIGDGGSGKTLLMQQFLARDESHWKVCRINAHDPSDAPFDEKLKNMVAHRAYMYTKAPMPIIMMDDAHTLTRDELSFLLRLAGVRGFQRQIDKLVFFCESSLLSRLSELSDILPDEGVVEKIYMPKLTLMETQDYVSRRLASAKVESGTLFSRADLELIHEESGGSPGGINHAAARMYDRKKQDGVRIKRFFKQFFSGKSSQAS